MTNEDRPAPDQNGDQGNGTPDPLAIVGIGASAGGLAALKTFFGNVPVPTGVAFVVVVHLSREHESHLAQLLQPHCPLPVQQVNETVRIEPDRVYIIPPNANLNTIDTHLRLSDLEERRQERAPIDHFFRTLAQTHDGNAVGVILTGTGSDGTLGLRRVKEQGGLTIAQDPAEAEYDGMPRSAIASGMVDLVLPLAAIPAAIVKFSRTEPRIPPPGERKEPEEDQERLLQKVFAQVRARTGHDFNQYKRSTILRRIARRMQLHHVETLTAYLDLMRKDRGEAADLFNDLLITVTEFFRDREVFDELEGAIVPGLFAGKGAGDRVRVWSVGCSTGEEAYSLAILLLEEAARRELPPQLQVFASDLHEVALARARDGVYPEEIAGEVTADRLKRFFVKENGSYRVRREVREVVVFAPHNLLSDPPFSHLDLIVCRNLLIYLQKDVQHDVVGLFHYALNPDGLLLLGTSEMAGRGDLFAAADKGACLFRKRNVPSPEPRLPRPALPRFWQGNPEAAPAPPEPRAGYGAIHERMVERYAPPSVLINHEYGVVHSSAGAGRYLHLPGGEPTTDLLRLVREPLRIELRAALHAARDSGRPAGSRPVVVDLDGEPRRVSVQVRPAADPELAGFLLVCFDETAPAFPPAGGEEAAGTPARELEAEVELYRRRLQSAAEEYEASREQMQAANEELQSANEELRSTMEELETSKEELQSMNEELATLNQEHRHRAEELGQLSDDLHNLLASTDIATLFLDRELRIVRFTPQIGELFNVRHTDRGRPLTDLTHHLGYAELAADARRVLDRLERVEREVGAAGGRWYLARVLPYRTTDDRIEGVVITFVDITDRKKAEEELAQAKEYAESIVETLHEPLLVLHPDLIVHRVNPAFYQHFQVSPAQTLGRKVYDLGNGQWDIPVLRTLLEDVLPSNNVFSDYEVTHDFEDIGRRVMLVNGRRLDHVQLILLGIRDITDRKRAEEALRESEARLQRMLNIPVVGVLVFDAATGALLDANDAFLHMSGYTRADVESRALTWREMTPPEYIAASEEQLRLLVASGQLGPYGKEYICKDGSRSWMLFAGASLGDGTLVEYCIDVAGRKRAEAAVRESEERLRLALSAARMGTWSWEVAADRHRRDPNLNRLLGLEPVETVLPITEFFGHVHPDDRDTVRAAFDASVRQGHNLRLEFRVVWPGGEVRWLRDQGDVFGVQDGRHLAGACLDVTDRRRLEEELRRLNTELENRVAERTSELWRQNERLRRLAGELAEAEQRERARLGAVLHDGLQQILVAARMHLPMCTGENPVESAARVEKLLGEALDACRSLSFELSPPALHHADLLGALRWLAGWFRDNHRFEVTVEVGDDFPGRADGQKVFLFGIVRELLLNAVKHSGAQSARVELHGEPGLVRLTVADQGKGFDPADLEREDGSRAGIGLVSIRERLAAMGGKLRIHSHPGDGASFVVELPIR